MQESQHITFFDILNDILIHKTGELHKCSGFKQNFKRFVIIRYLSMAPELIKYSAYFNNEKFSLFSDEDLYIILCNSIPIHRKFIKFIKKAKKTNDIECNK